MNNARRKTIRTIIKMLREDNPDVNGIRDDLEDLLAEEEEAMENLPESLQESERYMIMEESCEYLQEALDELDDADEDDLDFASVILSLEQIDGV